MLPCSDGFDRSEHQKNTEMLLTAEHLDRRVFEQCQSNFGWLELNNAHARIARLRNKTEQGDPPNAETVQNRVGLDRNEGRDEYAHMHSSSMVAIPTLWVGEWRTSAERRSSAVSLWHESTLRLRCVSRDDSECSNDRCQSDLAGTTRILTAGG